MARPSRSSLFLADRRSSTRPQSKISPVPASTPLSSPVRTRLQLSPIRTNDFLLLSSHPVASEVVRSHLRPSAEIFSARLSTATPNPSPAVSEEEQEAELKVKLLTFGRSDHNQTGHSEEQVPSFLRLPALRLADSLPKSHKPDAASSTWHQESQASLRWPHALCRSCRFVTPLLPSLPHLIHRGRIGLRLGQQLELAARSRR